MNTNSQGEIRSNRNKSGQIESQENAALHINGRELTETVLSESEQHQRLLEQQKIIQTSLDGFWVARAADARILEANEAFCSMVGYSRDELLSMRISDLEADESPAETAAHIQKVRAIGYDRFETRHRHKQGHLIDLEISVSYSESDGGINFVFARDITERKRMEEALVNRERELRALAESSPGMMGSFYLRPDGSMCMPYVSSKIWGHFGLMPQEVAVDATPLLARTHPDDAQMVQDSIAESARSLTTWHVEYRILHPTKGVRWMESNTNPEPHPDGGVIWYGYVHDITARKVAEEELRASEQKFRSLAENLPDILIRYDREGRRTYVNPALERIFAATDKQMIGLTQQESNPTNLPETYQLALQHTLATGERSEFEMQVPVPSGEVRIGYIYIAAERAGDGKISGAITIGRDITKLKQAEQQLRDLAAHLQSVREEEKARLAREIHDDLGSTLAALKLKLSHLLDFELAEEVKNTPLFARLESMSFILENAIAATRRIIADMRPDVLDNLGLFAALKWQAEQFHQHTGIMCRIVCANDLGCVDCRECAYQLDKTQSINLFRIFQEALTNVSRHSGATSVVAEYRPGADHVHLSISDDGCGLPEGHVPATTSFGIRGMRERVGQMGGQLAFDNALGGGLCVTVRLPFVAGNKGGADNPA